MTLRGHPGDLRVTCSPAALCLTFEASQALVWALSWMALVPRLAEVGRRAHHIDRIEVVDILLVLY